MPPKPNGMTTRGRFELPVLAPLDSLTAGTNIPPPEPSPVHEQPPETMKPAEVSALSEGAPIHSNGNGTSKATINRSVAPSIASPTSVKRPASIRRFLSRKSLNDYYENDGIDYSSSRPESPSTFSTVSTRPDNKRRSSSWFSRIMGTDGAERKRTSMVLEEKEEPVAKKGPPPPQLPQLNQLKAKVTNKSLDMDPESMFGNIR